MLIESYDTQKYLMIEQLERDNDKKIRNVCIFCMAMAAICIVVMLSVANTETSDGELSTKSPVGWISVCGASIIFGTTGKSFYCFVITIITGLLTFFDNVLGIPMKTEALKTKSVNSFVFSLYTSFGVFLVTLPLLIYLLAVQRFEFKPFAFLGGLDIYIIGYFAYQAVQSLGYSKAPAIWAGVGMISAFIWGAVVFGENVDNLVGGIFSILVLALGVYCVSTSQSKDEEQYSQGACTVNDFNSALQTTSGANLKNSSSHEKSCEKINCEIENADILFEGHEASLHCQSDRAPEVLKYLRISPGYLFCLLTGLCDGALMVPFKLSAAKNLGEALSYVVSFALCNIMVAPVAFCMYCICIKSVPDLHLGCALVPAALSGALCEYL